jgi:hypothetical protein
MYLFLIADNPNRGKTSELAHRTIEEAVLFIEAAHACYDRIQEQKAQKAVG